MTRTKPKKRAHAKNKSYKRSHSTKRRKMDVDQIQDHLQKEQETGEKLKFDLDEDLAGMGQFYCTPCGRHFVNQSTLDDHIRSKLHKRRLKDVAQKQYNQAEADMAAGKTKEILPPAHNTTSMDS